MAILVSAQTGTAVTPAELLGTEEEDKQNRFEEAEKGLKSLLRRMSKAGLESTERKKIVKAMQAAAAPQRAKRKGAVG